MDSAFQGLVYNNMSAKEEKESFEIYLMHKIQIDESKMFNNR